MKLVFLHGAGCSSLSFYYQLRHFRNSKALDLPGHPEGAACTDVDGYLEWVRGFITARRYKDVVLCGHSMGGAITLKYALRYPEELKGIILLGTGPASGSIPNTCNGPPTPAKATGNGFPVTCSITKLWNPTSTKCWNKGRRQSGLKWS